MYKHVVLSLLVVSLLIVKTLNASNNATNIEINNNLTKSEAEKKNESKLLDRVNGKTYANNNDKSSMDPTKVITNLGASYSNKGPQVNVSVGLDDTKKLNFRYTFGVDGNDDEYSAGASWLFRIGIINMNAQGTSYDDGAKSNSLYIGTYVPLTFILYEKIFGYKNLKEAIKGTVRYPQIFPMAGYSFSKGKVSSTPQFIENITDGAYSSDEQYVHIKTNGGYIGAFGLIQLIPKMLTVFGWGGYNIGKSTFYDTPSASTSTYRGYFVGGGIAYKFTKQDTIGVFMSYNYNNQYDGDTKYGIFYHREFTFTIDSLFMKKKEDK